MYIEIGGDAELMSPSVRTQTRPEAQGFANMKEFYGALKSEQELNDKDIEIIKNVSEDQMIEFDASFLPRLIEDGHLVLYSLGFV